MKNYKSGDTITAKEYQDLIAELDARWENKGKIEPGKTVYFDKNIQISRKEFKKQYPDNPIVYDLSKANYYVADYKPHVWISFHNSPSVKLDDAGWRGESRITQLNKIVDFINSNAIRINSKAIKFKSENEEIPQETIQKIQQMLQSPDKETLDLGIKILFQYNHVKCLDTFYVLLARANSMTWWRRTKSRVTEQKIKFIKEQFSNHRF